MAKANQPSQWEDTLLGIRRTLQEALGAARYFRDSNQMDGRSKRRLISILRFMTIWWHCRKINALWKSYEKYHWYDAQDFWKKGTVKHQAQTIKLFSEEYDDYEPFDSRSFWKI